MLIAGCGYVGSELARELSGAGDSVFALRRRSVEPLPGVTSVRADLDDPASLDVLPRDLDAVVYCVAADRFDDAAYRAAYVAGPRHLIDALARAGERPRRFVFVSSTAVYGQHAGEWVDEASFTEPAAFSGARMLEGEQVALAAPFAATVLRLGGIYGPGRTRLIDSVRSGRARLGPHADDFGNRIHRDDCAGAIRHLLGLGEVERVYLGVDREPASERDVLGWIASRLALSAPVEDLAASVAPDASRRPRGSKRCSSARLVTSGYGFRFPTFREGYGALISSSDSSPGTPMRSGKP